MTPTVRQISGRMVILERSNLDADQIIPARFLRNPRERGYRDFLFHDLRRHSDHQLSRHEVALHRARVVAIRLSLHSQCAA